MAQEQHLKHGITENTLKNMMLGAGTIHKGLTYAAETGWNFKASLIGATSGGSKFTVTPETKQIEIDGAIVAVKGLDIKQGETAVLETNFAEITEDVLKWATMGQANVSSTVTGYTEFTSKAKIQEGDYIENLAFVGETVGGKPIIIIFDYALCTSGLEVEGKNKENAVIKATFECRAEMSGNLDVLPWHIYYPTPVAKSTKIEAKTK